MALSLWVCFCLFVFSRQGFGALEPVLELVVLVDQADLKLTEIHPPVSASLVLGLKACTPPPGWIWGFLKGKNGEQGGPALAVQD